MMVLRKPYFFRKRKPAIVQKIVLIIKIPEGCTNLAFIGQYVEIDDDVVFTIETSVRTPLEAVYMLTGLNKDIIEVNPSRYDIRYLVENFKKLSGIKGAITEKDLPKINPFKIREQTAEKR